MSRLLLSVEFPRCPSCGVLYVAAWPLEHRPNCPHTDTPPNEWSTP
jgi:rubredoxin